MTGYSIFLVYFLCHGLPIYGETLPADEEYDHTAFTILNLKASEIEALIQAGRKFVHSVKKWQDFHPAETIFGKCIIRYCIDLKIPNMLASDWNEEGRRGLSSSPVWLTKMITKESDIQPRERTFNASELNSLKQIKIRAVKALYIIYVNVRDLLSQYMLLNCFLRYLISKFWEWIDNAP